MADGDCTPTIQNGRDRLLIGVPKKGRLNEKVMKLLDHIDLQFQRSARQDVAQSTNMNVTVVFLPASDVALFVGLGRVDMGITGRDMVAEKEVVDTVDELAALNFGKCRLCVQAPIASQIQDVKQLAGKRIATSFPVLTKKFFQEVDPSLETHIDFVSGSVEAACALGLADAVVDLVETGETMKAAGLEVICDIMKTEAVLIANKHPKHQTLQDVITKRIVGAVAAQQLVMIEYNVPRVKLSDATKITPGKKSATVSALECEDWCAVRALIKKKESNLIMDQLEMLGATDLVIYDILNLR